MLTMLFAGYCLRLILRASALSGHGPTKFERGGVTSWAMASFFKSLIALSAAFTGTLNRLE